METPFIIGDNIYFRPLELSDLKTCQGWLNHPTVTPALNKGQFPVNEIAEREYLESLHKPQDFINLAICLKTDDLHIGNCGLHDIKWVDRTAFLGILIGETDYWNQGYGTEAIRLILDHAFRRMNMNRVDLNVYEFNKGAIRCYEKAGFFHEGRKRQSHYHAGRYWDGLIMSILREEWEQDGPSP